MIRRALRRGLAIGVLVGLAVVVVRAVRGRTRGPLDPLPASTPWPTLAPEPAVPDAPPVDLRVVAAPDPRPEPEAGAGWVAPIERTCPTSHPVKVRLASGIFHLPGMVDYDRTRPDRCYVDATAAENDGFRPARR